MPSSQEVRLESEDCDGNTLHRQQIQPTSKGFAALPRHFHSETHRGGEEWQEKEKWYSLQYYDECKEYTAKGTTLSKTKDIRCRGIRECSGLYIESTKKVRVNPIKVI